MVTTNLHVRLTLSKAVYLNRSTVTHVRLCTSIYIELGLVSYFKHPQLFDIHVASNGFLVVHIMYVVLVSKREGYRNNL